MLAFERIVADLGALGVNLYDFSLYAPDGTIRTHRFQPCNRCNDSYSVAKAFTMTAVGLLWDDGLLDVDDSLYAIFGRDFPEDADPAWRLATVEHALTHRLGYDASQLDIDVDDVSAYPTDDYLRLALSKPLPFAPGTHYQYTDAAFYLLSRAVDHVCGEKADSLLWRRILRPMGCVEAAWSRCPMGYPMGATGLYIGAGDMVKLGALYLHEGVFGGRRLISADWVRMALERGYEFQTMAPNGLIGKGGMYGQGLAFSREKGFAAAWHAFEQSEGCRRIAEYLDNL